MKDTPTMTTPTPTPDRVVEAARRAWRESPQAHRDFIYGRAPEIAWQSGYACRLAEEQAARADADQMSGPDHYREAQRYLTHAEAGPGHLIAERMQLAQVHATLAAAAAAGGDTLPRRARGEQNPIEKQPDEVAVLDTAHDDWHAIAKTDHVHNTAGVCLKNRGGDRCPDPAQTAAIQRIRDLHFAVLITSGPDTGKTYCHHCRTAFGVWPCATTRALDGIA